MIIFLMGLVLVDLHIQFFSTSMLTILINYIIYFFVLVTLKLQVKKMCMVLVSVNCINPDIHMIYFVVCMYCIYSANRDLS